MYALFGQLQSKIKNENLVSRSAKTKDLEVALLLAVDKQDYIVRRSISKSKSSGLSIARVDNGKETDITKSTISETQEMIEKDIIRCDITIFLRTILLTADQTYNFYMLKKADKKEFVEKMFDISVFEEMYKAIHKDALLLDKEAAASSSKIMVLSKNNDDYEARKTTFETSREAKLKVLAKSLEDLEKKHEAAKKKVDEDLSQSSIDALNDEISRDVDEIDKSMSRARSLQESKMKSELEIHKLEESAKIKRSAIDKHKDILKKLCSDCRPVFVKHYSLDGIAKEVKSLNEKREQIASSMSSSIDEQIRECDGIAKSLRAEIASKRSKLKSLIDSSSAAKAEARALESEIKDAERQLEQAKSGVNPYDDLLSKCQTDLAVEKDKLEKTEVKMKYLKNAETIVSQDTLRKFIIKDLVVLLNNKIKTYLTKLGAQYYVEFDEDMDYEFITANGSCEWSNFSAGERMRIMIATSFAFRDFMSIRNGLNANILVLDEYFDSAIDTLCVESIVNILKEYSSKQHQRVFVISHRPDIGNERFDRVLCVEKTDGIAHIVR